MPEIRVISMGPGGTEYLTQQALEALHSAEVLIGTEKFRGLLPEFEILVPEKILNGTLKLIDENRDKVVGVLVTGDAGFYSLAKSVVKEFGIDSVRVIPGVSVVQLAFARLGEPWDDLSMFSLHGRETVLTEDMGASDKFILLCDNKTTAKGAVTDMFDLTETHDLTVMENLSMEDENIVNIKNEEDIESLTGASLGLVVGIRRVYE